MTYKYLFTLLFLFLIIPSIAQRKLILAKPASPAKYVFYEGEEIRFKLKGDKYWNKARIQGLGDDFIRLHYATLSLSEIEAIDVSGKGGSSYLHTMEIICIYGGIGFIAIDHFNKIVIRDEPGIDKTTMLIGGTLLSVAAIIHFLKRKKVKPGRKFVLRVGEY